MVRNKLFVLVQSMLICTQGGIHLHRLSKVNWKVGLEFVLLVRRTGSDSGW